MLRVLVIDDEAAIRKLVRQALERVRTSRRRCRERPGWGIELLHAVRYDLVITDIVMPEMERHRGGDRASIRRHWPDVPVIAMSGGGRCGDADDPADRARGLGAASVLNKPFTMLQAARGGEARLRQPRFGLRLRRRLLSWTIGDCLEFAAPRHVGAAARTGDGGGPRGKGQKVLEVVSRQSGEAVRRQAALFRQPRQ